MIKPLCQYIEDELGWTIGDNLAPGGFKTSSPASCVAVLDSGGVPDPERMNSHEVRVQCIVRANGEMISRALAYQVFDLFRFRGALTLPIAPSGETWDAWVINSTTIISMPQHTGQDEKGRDRWTFNLLFYAYKV